MEKKTLVWKHFDLHSFFYRATDDATDLCRVVGVLMPALLSAGDRQRHVVWTLLHFLSLDRLQPAQEKQAKKQRGLLSCSMFSLKYHFTILLIEVSLIVFWPSHWLEGDYVSAAPLTLVHETPEKLPVWGYSWAVADKTTSIYMCWLQVIKDLKIDLSSSWVSR